MNVFKRIVISVTLVGLPLSALAGNDDRHGHEHGQPKRHHEQHFKHGGHRGHQQNYRPETHHDGHARDGNHHGRQTHSARVYAPAVVHAPVPHSDGVSVQGNVHIPF